MHAYIIRTVLLILIERNQNNTLMHINAYTLIVNAYRDIKIVYNNKIIKYITYIRV